MPASGRGACSISSSTEQTGESDAMSTGGRSRPSRSARPPLRLVLEALADRKAVDPIVLDLRGLCGATDYFVICSGTSDTHVRGMADHLMESLAPRGIVPHHVEGLAPGEGGGRWVLLDYVDFVVHVFHPELREFYQLERLWGDAPVVAAGDSGGPGGRGRGAKG